MIEMTCHWPPSEVLKTSSLLRHDKPDTGGLVLKVALRVLFLRPKAAVRLKAAVSPGPGAKRVGDGRRLLFIYSLQLERW